jgi:hypothetical protein
VVRGLKEQPGLNMENAGYVAAMILSRIYPCSE